MNEKTPASKFNRSFVARALVAALILLGALVPFTSASAQAAGSSANDPVTVDLSTNALEAPFIEANVWYQANLQRGDGDIFGLISLKPGDVFIETFDPADTDDATFIIVEQWPRNSVRLSSCNSDFADTVQSEPCGSIGQASTFIVNLSAPTTEAETVAFRIVGEAGDAVEGFEPDEQDSISSDEPAEPQPGLLVILDASGSMLRASGTSDRITEAKDATRSLLSGIEPTDAVGLRVYGHRVPSSQKAEACVDSELVVPVAADSVEAMLAVVDTVQALGETPIGYSLEQARSDLGEAGGRIVLISDGIDECFPDDLGPDPCDVATELADDGFSVRIDTIGFAAGAEASEQLSCIAEVTGGVFTAAANGAELDSILSSVGEEAVEELRGFNSTGLVVEGSVDPREAAVLSASKTYRTIAEPGVEALDFRLDVPPETAIVEIFVQVDAHARGESAAGTVTPRFVSGSSNELCEIVAGINMRRNELAGTTTGSQVCEYSDSPQGNSRTELELLRLQFDWRSVADSIPVPVEFRFLLRDANGELVTGTGTDLLLDELFSTSLPEPTVGTLDFSQPVWHAVDGDIESEIEVNAGDRIFAALASFDDEIFRLDLVDPVGRSGGCSVGRSHFIEVIDGVPLITVDCVVEESGTLGITSEGGLREIGFAIDRTDNPPAEPTPEKEQEDTPVDEDTFEDQLAEALENDDARIPTPTGPDVDSDDGEADGDADAGDEVAAGSDPQGSGGSGLGLLVLAAGIITLLAAGGVGVFAMSRNRS